MLLYQKEHPALKLIDLVPATRELEGGGRDSVLCLSPELMLLISFDCENAMIFGVFCGGFCR